MFAIVVFICVMKQLIAILPLVLIFGKSLSQDNYEIQVYGSETMTKHYTMLELHSNFTNNGSTAISKGVLPTNHVDHETIEITHGWNDWFETGFYIFNSIGSDNRTAYVGSHIRPRIALPQKYHFPVGLSLSVEVGYQKPQYCEDDWTLEIRPIIDKKINKLYLCFNPVFDKSLHGANASYGYNFSPNAKISYDINKTFSPGIEYYGALGELNNFMPKAQQQHNLFLSLDADFNPNWEFNIGYGLGFTSSTDNEIIKCIVGWRFK